MKPTSLSRLTRAAGLIAALGALWFILPRTSQAPETLAMESQAASSTGALEEELLDIEKPAALRIGEPSGSETHTADGPVAENEYTLTVRRAHDRSLLPETNVRFLAGNVYSPALADLRSNQEGTVSIPSEWAERHPLLTAIVIDDGVISKPLALELHLLDGEERKNLTIDADILVGTLVEISDGGGNAPVHDQRLWTRKGYQWKVYGIEQLSIVRKYLGCDPSCLGVADLQRSSSSPHHVLVWRVATTPQDRFYGMARICLSLPGYEELIQEIPFSLYESGNVTPVVVKQRSDIAWTNVVVQCTGSLVDDENPHSANSSPAVVLMESLQHEEVFTFTLEDLSQPIELVGIPAGPYRVSISGGTSGMLDRSAVAEVFDVSPSGGLIQLDLNPFGSLKLTGCDAVATGPTGVRLLRVLKDGSILRQDYFAGDSVVIEPVPAGEIDIVIGAQLGATPEECKQATILVEPATLAMHQIE